MLTVLILGSVIAAQPVWSKPLPSDARIRTGTFANGVKWYYRAHGNPPGKMALMIHIRSGSLNETDDQRGLAHFMEHLCFNGTEHFPPGELIPYFESIGMEFGADLNAFTSFDQTAYMLFTPDTETEQIGKALMVLSDYAFRASLVAEEIDKERGVILEESRTGKSAFQRVRDKLWPELFAGTRFAVRLPIGDEDVIANAPREQFVDYYRTWYRPENTTVVLVGDAEPERIVPLMEKWFGAYKAEIPQRPQKGAEFKPFTQERSIVVTDPELSRCSVQMLNIRPGRAPTVTSEQARVELIEYIGGWIMGRRYDEMVNEGRASFRRAGVDVSNFFSEALLMSGSASGEPADWAKMLEELVVEISRAREHGFTERELELARSELTASAERAVKTESTRNARRMVRGIVSAVNDKVPITSAQQDLDLYNELLPGITLGEVNDDFRKHFEPGTFAYVVQTPDKEGSVIPAREEVLAAARAAWARKTKPPTTSDAPTEILAKMPTPGKVVNSHTDKDLDVTSAWLSNGVRVHHRYMDYKEDTVMLSVSLAGGSIEETAANVGITQVAALAINEAATGRLTSTNIRDIMTGKKISVRSGRGGDSLPISVSGSPDDLETGLQLVHALLTDGKIEESAFKNWKLNTLRRIEMMEKMPRVKAFEGLGDLLSGGDPRQSALTKENVEALSLEQAQAWFDRLRRESPIEVAVVGHIKLDQAMPLIEKYLGSLPERSRSASHLDKLRRLARETGPLQRNIRVETVTPQGMAIAGFVGCEGRNESDLRRLQLASQVLTSRTVKRIREELSIVYSIRCSSSPSRVYEDAGRFSAGAPCDPANAARVVEEVHTLFKDFAENGMSEEELDNAKKQVANNLDTSMREPRYWMGVLRNHDMHHRDLNEEKTKKEAYKRITKEQVQSTFKKYCTPARQFRVTAVPAEPATPQDTPKKETADTPAS